MEIIRGKQASWMDARAFAECATSYDEVMIDIGTGDGRFVLHQARIDTRSLVIGVDACRENLHDASRRAPPNTLFAIANALTLPRELDGVAAMITINFPWGSLIDGLLSLDDGVAEGLYNITQPGARIEVRLNGGALAEAGWPLEAGADQVRGVLAVGGFDVHPPTRMSAGDLRAFPTTWAKRLAFGRDPRAMLLRGVRR